MSLSPLESVVIPPSSEHKSTIIWLHGLGDSGNGFAPIAPELKLPDELGTKFVFPHAPIRPVTINNGMKMRAWYDIRSLDMETRADNEGVMQSAEQVSQLIQTEIDAGVPSHKIALVGFSQGGVIALHLGTRFEHTLACIVGLSTYMSVPALLEHEKHPQNQQTPVLICHGQQDEVVPMFMGRAAYSTLTANKFNVSWKEYVMQHNVCLPEIKDISRFIQQHLS